MCVACAGGNGGRGYGGVEARECGGRRRRDMLQLWQALLPGGERGEKTLRAPSVPPLCPLCAPSVHPPCPLRAPSVPPSCPSVPPPCPLQTPSVRDLDSSKEPVRGTRSLLLGILGVHNVGNTAFLDSGSEAHGHLQLTDTSPLTPFWPLSDPPQG
eukprot:1192872-Prorocentrum_minimum.AAC.3